jgi:hypothetical protein
MADSGLLLAATLAEAERASNAFSPSFQVFNPDPTLLRGDPALLHPASYRLTHEAARHKILDLLGDLALLELRLPRLRLHLRNAGHYHHHQLLEALTHERFPT